MERRYERGMVDGGGGGGGGGGGDVCVCVCVGYKYAHMGYKREAEKMTR